jgi:hypothetical protein
MLRDSLVNSERYFASAIFAPRAKNAFQLRAVAIHNNLLTANC